MAQDQFPYPAGTPAANSLAAFRVRMLALPVLKEAPAPLAEYKLVWMEHHDGYSVFIHAVNDSTVLSDFGEELVKPFIVAEPPTFYGDRYAMLTQDIPVSMLNITHWYFERR